MKHNWLLKQNGNMRRGGGGSEAFVAAGAASFFSATTVLVLSPPPISCWWWDDVVVVVFVDGRLPSSERTIPVIEILPSLFCSMWCIGWWRWCTTFSSTTCSPNNRTNIARCRWRNKCKMFFIARLSAAPAQAWVQLPLPTRLSDPSQWLLWQL